MANNKESTQKAYLDILLTILRLWLYSELQVVLAWEFDNYSRMRGRESIEYVLKISSMWIFVKILKKNFFLTTLFLLALSNKKNSINKGLCIDYKPDRPVAPCQIPSIFPPSRSSTSNSNLSFGSCSNLRVRRQSWSHDPEQL